MALPTRLLGPSWLLSASLQYRLSRNHKTYLGPLGWEASFLKCFLCNYIFLNHKESAMNQMFVSSQNSFMEISSLM